MNYYNPYFYNMPMNNFNNIPRAGIFKNIFRGINFSSILNTTQKTLNIVNQTIPLIRQTGPILKNAKTMFKVMNEFKKIDKETVNEKNNEIKKIEPTPNYNEGPTFFI